MRSYTDNTTRNSSASTFAESAGIPVRELDDGTNTVTNEIACLTPMGENAGLTLLPGRISVEDEELEETIERLVGIRDRGRDVERDLECRT